MNRLRRQIKTLIDDGFKPASSCSIEGWGAAIAIGASAVIGAAGSAYASSQQASAAHTAANAQEQAAEDQMSLDANVFNAQAEMQQPSRELGGEAQSREAYLLGLDPNLDISADFSTPQISSQIGGSTLSWNGALGNTQQNGSSMFGGSSSAGYTASPTAASSGGGSPTASATNTGVTPVPAPGTSANTVGASNAWGAAGSGNPSGVVNPNAIYGSGSGTSGTSSAFGSFANPYNASTFTMDPGYNFIKAQGQQAITNQEATSGLALSPSALAAGLNYTTGLASQEFNNAYNRSINTQTTQLNELNALASGGQIATSGVSSAASNLGSAGSSAIGSYGNASAAGTIGASNALSSGISGVTNSIGGAANYYALGSLAGSGSSYNYNPVSYSAGNTMTVGNPGINGTGGYIVNVPN